MRLKKFEIRNFKGIEFLSFDWEDLVVLIGENNCGKSSVLQALNWFLGGSPIKDEHLCRNHVASEGVPVELTGHFDQLTPADKAQSAISGRTFGDAWILKKAFWCDSTGAWKEQYSSKAPVETFVGWPDNPTSWAAFPEEYREVLDAWNEKGARPSGVKLEQLRERIKATRPDLVTVGAPEWLVNPGGGGNWKSNANSILPRAVFIRAVHDASAESTSKDASSYGKLISLIIEKKMINRPEILALRVQIASVLKLFTPDPERPEDQAEEIRDLQDKINDTLNEVVEGKVRIQTNQPDVQPLLLPSTTLMMRAAGSEVETLVEHQGHGLQRSLIISLLQVLSNAQAELESRGEGVDRATIFIVEEPELYLHPQMERKMRDVLWRLASQSGQQAICCTHSPVFLDMGERHTCIVQIVKESGMVKSRQVLTDLFDGADAASQREHLKLLCEFHPGVNEVFFAKRVILCEGRTEVTAFEFAAQKIGIFTRHPAVRRDVTLIDCGGKQNIPLFQKVLNHFQIPYLAVYDEDTGNAASMADNPKIDGLVSHGHTSNRAYRIVPSDIETLLGYGSGNGPKPFLAMKKISEWVDGAGLPAQFVDALNTVYFGQITEPAVA